MSQAGAYETQIGWLQTIRFYGLGLQGFPSRWVPLVSHSPYLVSVKRRSETRAGVVSPRDLSVELIGRMCLVSHEEGPDPPGPKETDA